MQTMLIRDENELRRYIKEVIDNPNYSVTLDVKVVADAVRELEKLRT